MIDMGVIKESHCDWSSLVFLVPKAFCVDFRKVNAVSKFDAYPMPHTELN